MSYEIRRKLQYAAQPSTWKSYATSPRWTRDSVRNMAKTMFKRMPKPVLAKTQNGQWQGSRLFQWDPKADFNFATSLNKNVFFSRPCD